jgi:hypothetical protein
MEGVMNNKILCLALFLLIPVTGCYSQQDKGGGSIFPQMTGSQKIEPSPLSQGADANTWDFGQIKAGEVVKHDFVLKNDSAKVLKISGINTSCGCTGSKTDKNQLSPGESANIEVQFNSKNYNGPIQQFVYVNTDSIDTPVIKYIIKAEVTK